MPQKQSTLEASYIIDHTKSASDITTDIYGPTGARKKASDVSTLWESYVNGLSGTANIPWERLRTAFPVEEEEEEEDDDDEDEDEEEVQMLEEDEEVEEEEVEPATKRSREEEDVGDESMDEEEDEPDPKRQRS